GLATGLDKLFLGKRNLQHDRLGRSEQAFQMLFETEDAPVIQADALKHAVAVQQAVVEDRYLRFVCRDIFAIQINFHCRVLTLALIYSKIFPSAISNTRSPRVATCSSWVTITSVV